MARAQSPSLQPGGDLPDPKTLEAYRSISPNYADKILSVFEAQAEHQRKMEQAALTARVNFAFRGQVFGFVIGLAAIGGGLTIAMYGHEWAGAFFSNGGLAGLVSIFVIGRRGEPQPPGEQAPMP